MNITAEIFQKAIEFAVRAHQGVYRKGTGEPYIMHPLAVAARVKSVKGDTSNLFLLMTAAVLHDTVEDVEWVTLDLIAKEFGHAVAALVEELTLDKDQYEKLGKKEYLAREIVQMSSYARVLKLCDRLENVMDMGKMKTSFQKRYTIETLYMLERLEQDGARKITPTQRRLMYLILGELEQYQHLIKDDAVPVDE
jgi:(p)ppGpp synthase/HD superfamily hydrolase